MVQNASPARIAALELLRAVRRGEFVDRAFDREADGLESADRRLAQELAYGVLRLRGRIDYILDARIRDGLGSLEPDARDILRIAIYQLLELDRVPAYAAVSEAVTAARRCCGAGVARLTNAVLRRSIREGVTAVGFPDREPDSVGYLSTWGSHPAWLVKRWLERWPTADVERLVEHNNRRPAVYLSVLEPVERALETLGAGGVEAETVTFPGTMLRIAGGDVVRALERVSAVVQDPAAAGVVEYASLPDATWVLDGCAAPGGKATLLAARGHDVLALDASKQRLDRLVEHRKRLEISELRPVVADVGQPPVRDVPAVLLDVPCLGTGTLARHPDARWRLQERQLDELTDAQGRMLEAASRVVRPGGYLVYATCSLEPEENEEQVEAFLNRKSDFEMAPPAVGTVPDDVLTPRGEYRTLPQRHGIDGAYAARIRRIR